VLELLDLRFELGDGLFEIQKGNGHERFYRKFKCCARLRAGAPGRKVYEERRIPGDHLKK
jgi:hypothetical protein